MLRIRILNLLLYTIGRLRPKVKQARPKGANSCPDSVVRKSEFASIEANEPLSLQSTFSAHVLESCIG